MHATILGFQENDENVFVIGEDIDHYRILGKVGEGGMGVVYEAEDTRLSRTVALKLLAPGIVCNQEAKERFVHEARAASALDHPNICTVHEISETCDHQLYIVMACYNGETLNKILERGPLDFEKTADIASQIALGLAAAHRKGIVHRDVKPANVFVTNEGLVKILDFGLAKLIGDARSKMDEGVRAGTVVYMSPEQARGEKIDTRSDIWSFGVVLYEMLAGRVPFEGTYEHALLYSILNEEPKTLTYHNPDIPEHLCRIVERCLQKDPDRRVRNFDEVLVELSPEKRFRRFLVSLRDLPQQINHLRRLVIAVVSLITLAVLALFLWRDDNQAVNPTTERILLKGRVVDSTRTPVPAASVTLVAVHFQAFTREDGTFLGVVENRRPGEKLVLVISHPEHQTRKIDHIINSSEEDFGEITLKK